MFTLQMTTRNNVALSGLGVLNLLPKPRVSPWAVSTPSLRDYMCGENVGDTMVKDLIATVEHEKAAIGLFVTLTELTKPMRTRAVSARFGVYPVRKSPIGSPRRTYPKIQILTIEGLLNDTERPEFPDLSIA